MWEVFYKYAAPAVLSLLAIFAPIQAMLIAALKQGDKLRSDKLRKTIVKLLLYEGAICVAYIAETYLMPGADWLVKHRVYRSD